MALDKELEEWDTKQFIAAKNEIKPTLSRVKFPDIEKLTLVLMGDTHIGSRFYASDLHKRHLEWCEKDNAYLLLMGDNIEAATRDSVGAGVYEQQEIIDQQVEHFYQLYRPFAEAGKIIGMHGGNHEYRVFKSCGVDIAKIMARELKIPYFDWARATIISVGKENYTIYTTHGASGARLPTSKIKAAFNMADVIDSEIYAMGHVHLLGHQARNYYTVDLRSKSVKVAEKHYILTGHYLNFWGSYAHMSNMEPNKKGCVKLKLHGEEHLIRVSL